MTRYLFLIPCKLFFIFLLPAIFTHLNAQDIPVKIKVINQKNESVESATVTVVNRFDSVQLNVKQTDSAGIAIFNLRKNGQYSIKISTVNYQTEEKGITVTDNNAFFQILSRTLTQNAGKCKNHFSKTIDAAGR